MTDTPTVIEVSSPGIPKWEAAAPAAATLVAVPVGGPRGPKGDPGLPGDAVALAKTHNQTNPSTMWLAVHNLGFTPAGVVVRDNAGNRHYPRRISHPEPGVSTQLTFDYDVFGTADFS